MLHVIALKITLVTLTQAVDPNALLTLTALAI